MNKNNNLIATNKREIVLKIAEELTKELISLETSKVGFLSKSEYNKYKNRKIDKCPDGHFLFDEYELLRPLREEIFKEDLINTLSTMFRVC